MENYRIFGPPHAVFNLSKLGLRYFRIGINASPISRDVLVKYFVGHPNVGWIFFAEGWFNLAVGIWAKDNAEMNDVSSQIRRALGEGDEIVFQSELISLYGFGNRPATGDGESMSIVDSVIHPIDLSSLEIDYIKLIALDSSLDDTYFSMILGVDEELIVSLRKKLMDSGVIVGYQERINYDGIYYKVFIDSLGTKTNDAVDRLMDMLWQDTSCIYFGRANSKYDIEFEVIVKHESDLNRYLKNFSEYKTSRLEENLYTNLYPLNKVANMQEIKEALATQVGASIDLCNSKLWYLNYAGAEAYLNIYENNKEYFEVMEKSELDLFDEVVGFLRQSPDATVFDVCDIGSGNGLKGRMFIEKLSESAVKAYYPIDIQPIELEAALRAHMDGQYAKHPTLLNIENLSARFPLKTLPNERQIFMIFGGTYGNYPSTKINGYLRSVMSDSTTLLVTMPIVGETKTDDEIMASYASIEAEDIAFGPLRQIGFKKDDFESNPLHSTLKVHIAIEERCNILFFVLGRTVRCADRAFEKGTVFKMTTSWKPTFTEFQSALKRDFIIDRIFQNKDMAIAVITRTV